MEDMMPRPDNRLARAKRPTEEFRLSWDFVNDAEASDSYVSHTITATVVSTGADATGIFLQSPTRLPDFVDPDGRLHITLGVQVQGGTDGLDYDVTFRLVTTQGDAFERVVRVAVRA
jgi:hypothetical protein